MVSRILKHRTITITAEVTAPPADIQGLKGAEPDITQLVRRYLLGRGNMIVWNTKVKITKIED